MHNLFARQSQIGYILKIAGVVVMAWGVIQGIFSLVMMVQMGGHYNEWGELQFASGMSWRSPVRIPRYYCNACPVWFADHRIWRSH